MALTGPPTPFATEAEMAYCLTGYHTSYDSGLIGLTQDQKHRIKGPHLRFVFDAREAYAACQHTLSLWAIPFRKLRSKDPLRFYITLDQEGIDAIGKLFVGRYNKGTSFYRAGYQEHNLQNLPDTVKESILGIITDGQDEQIVDDIIKRITHHQDESTLLSWVGKDNTNCQLMRGIDHFISEFVKTHITKGLWPDFIRDSFSGSGSFDLYGRREPSPESDVDANLSYEDAAKILRQLTGVEFIKTKGLVTSTSEVRKLHLRAAFPQSKQSQTQRIRCELILQIFGINYAGNGHLTKLIGGVNHELVTVDLLDCVKLARLFEKADDKDKEQWTFQFDPFNNPVSAWQFDLFFANGKVELIEEITARLPPECSTSHVQSNLAYVIDEFTRYYLSIRMPRKLWPEPEVIMAAQELGPTPSPPLSLPITYRYDNVEGKGDAPANVTEKDTQAKTSSFARHPS